jgi:hypothetical protein
MTDEVKEIVKELAQRCKSLEDAVWFLVKLIVIGVNPKEVKEELLTGLSHLNISWLEDYLNSL